MVSNTYVLELKEQAVSNSSEIFIKSYSCLFFKQKQDYRNRYDNIDHGHQKIF